MNVNARHNSIKVWPHLTLVFLVCAALGGVAAALWMRHEPKAEAFAVPRAARVERVDGEVGLGRDLDLADAGGEENWTELTPNTPLTVGDRLYAREDSRASLAFTGRNFATIDPDSALDVVSLSDRRTQLALREGSAIFDLGELAPGELFEVATPYGAVDFQEPGLYQVGYNDDGSAFVSVLSGLAQVVGLAARAEAAARGERATQARQQAQASREQQRASAHQQRFEARRQAEANAQAQRQAEQQQRAQRAQQQQEMMRSRQEQQQQRRAERQQQQPQPRPAMQAPRGQERKQQQAPASGPPSGGGGKGQGQGHGGGGKGKGKH